MNILKRISLLLSFVVLTSLMSASPSSAEALTITGPATISAVVGTAITPATYTASGGTGVYTSIAISAEIGNGFTAAASATSMLISGSALAPQSATSYTITVTDDSGATATATVSISAAYAPLVITGPGTITAIVGTAITPATYTASGGTGVYTSIAISAEIGNGFTAAASATSMLISGSALAPQSATSYTITVTDDSGATATATVSISAAYAPLVITGPGTITAIVGTAITPATYTASGGTGVYTSIAISAEIGNGFTAAASATSMLISGSALAPQSATSYTITVTDDSGATATATVSISAAYAPLVITGPGTITAIVGTAITPATYTASGGTGVYTSIAISAEIGNGFTAAASATSMLISGSALAPQSATSYTITVTDDSGATATATVSISAAYAPLVITGPGTITAIVGTAITPATYTASGGTGVYTSIAMSAEIGNGFTAAASATSMLISGSALAPQSATSYTITVTDDSGATATATVSISAAYAPLVITGPGTITAIVGTAITPATYTASGGTGVYTSIAISAEIGNGFTAAASATSMLISGSALAPQSATSYTITVTDDSGATATATVSISAAYAPLVITGPGTITAIVGTAITPATYTASGGTGVYTSIAISAEIGNGFTAAASATSMLISGSALAPQSATSYTITVTDDSGATATATVSISAAYAPLVITGPNQINVIIGDGQFVQYSVSGAVGGATFSVSPAVTGVSISSTSGALTVLGSLDPGSYSILVSAVDSRGVTGFISVQIVVSTSSSGSGNQSTPSEIRVIAPNFQITEGDVLPDLIPTYSSAANISSQAICEIFSSEGKITGEIIAGQYDIICRGATTNNGAKITYVPGVLKVQVKSQDPADAKLDALIERPRIVYVSPNVQVNAKISLQNARGKTLILVNFDQKSVTSPSAIYFAPWPNNVVDKTTPVIKVIGKDNKGSVLTTLEKPMSLKFPKVPANSIPAFSTDGNDWINFPQITKSDLTDGILEGFYTDANGEITIFTEELGLIGFRLAQKSFALSVRNKKSLYGLTDTVQIKTPRLLGTGEISYQSLLPRACSISNDGVVKTITGGECLVIAKKASDSKYSTTTSEVLTLKFTVPPTPKPTPKPSVKPTKSPSTKPTTGPTPPVTTPKAPKGYAIIPGIDGVFTPAKDAGTKNNVVLKLGAQISGEFNQQLNSQFAVSLSGLDKGAVISPILVTPEGLSAILQSGKYDSTKQYVSQSLKFTKTGTYKIIFRIAGTNTARVISINIK